MEQYIKLFDSLDDLIILEQEPLSRYTGFRTGGSATIVVPQTEDSFVNTYRTIIENHIPFFVLGNGSNVMAYDEGYDYFWLMDDDTYVDSDALKYIIDSIIYFGFTL